MDKWAGPERAAFEAVWSRVTAGRSGPVEVVPEPADERPGRLRGLIETLSADAGGYRALARLPGRGRAELLELAGQKRAQARRVSALYFLLSGVRYRPSLPAARPRSRLGALRERIGAETALAGELAALAEGPGADRALFSALARETAEAAEKLRAILEREI